MRNGVLRSLCRSAVIGCVMFGLCGLIVVGLERGTSISAIIPFISAYLNGLSEPLRTSRRKARISKMWTTQIHESFMPIGTEARAAIRCMGACGRVTIIGKFQAKGIGQTPLVGQGAPAGHSHGCMSLAEAVLEALFAEIAAAEFPCAAVPIIAIMDTGLTFSSPDPEDKYDQNVPRAIAVRPAAVRIAHAERAPLFKSSVTGFANVQATDALRTKEIIDTWMASAGRKGPSPEGVGPHFPRSAGHTVATASGPGWTPRRAQFYAYFSANGQIPRRNFHDACASSRCRERPQCSASTMRGRRSGAL